MPHFVLTCLDKPDALETRLATRPAHGAYVAERLNIVRLAGPFLNDEGQMVGSLIIFECEDKSVVEDFVAGDPYTQAGVFASHDVKGFTVARGSVG